MTFSRSGLAQWLIDTARRRYPGRITYNFNVTAEEIDFKDKKVGAADGGGGGRERGAEMAAAVWGFAKGLLWGRRLCRGSSLAVGCA